jgi:uncharacterized phage infection (PIP) family protein YhgE
MSASTVAPANNTIVPPATNTTVTVPPATNPTVTVPAPTLGNVNDIDIDNVEGHLKALTDYIDSHPTTNFSLQGVKKAKAEHHGKWVDRTSITDAHFKKIIEDQQALIAKLTQQNVEDAEELKKCEEDMDKLRTDLQAAEQANTTLTGERDTWKTDHGTLKTAHDILTSDHAILQQSEQDFKDQIRTLEESVKRLEGNVKHQESLTKQAQESNEALGKSEVALTQKVKELEAKITELNTAIANLQSGAQVTTSTPPVTNVPPATTPQVTNVPPVTTSTVKPSSIVATSSSSLGDAIPATTASTAIGLPTAKNPDYANTYMRFASEEDKKNAEKYAEACGAKLGTAFAGTHMIRYLKALGYKGFAL